MNSGEQRSRPDVDFRQGRFEFTLMRWCLPTADPDPDSPPVTDTGMVINAGHVGIALEGFSKASSETVAYVEHVVFVFADVLLVSDPEPLIDPRVRCNRTRTGWQALHGAHDDPRAHDQLFFLLVV